MTEASARTVVIGVMALSSVLLRPAMAWGNPAYSSSEDSAASSGVRSQETVGEMSRSGYGGYELGAGYLFFSDGVLDFPIGWNAHFAKNAGRSFGFVGEVSQSFTSGSDTDLSVLTIAGGVRSSLRGEGPMVPYANVLAGLARTSPGGTDPTVIAGAGVDWMLSPRLSLRTGAEYQALFTGGMTESTVRLQVGVVYRMGRQSAPARTEDSRRPGARAGAIEATPARRPDREPPSPTPRTLPPAPEPPSPSPTPPVPPPSVEPTTAPPPTQIAPQPPTQIAPQPAPQTPASPAAPSTPQQPDPGGSREDEVAQGLASAFDRGRELLLARDYPAAAAAFLDHLEGNRRFTIAVGLFCEPQNLSERLEGTNADAPLWVRSVPVDGRICFGVYWGFYDTPEQAADALRTLPEVIRSSQPIVLSTESLRR